MVAGRIGTVLAVVVASPMLAGQARAASPSVEQSDAVASPGASADADADAQAWRRYERRRRGLIAGVAVSGTATAAALGLVFGGIGINARQTAPYANYGAISMIYGGSAIFVAGGIALVVTGVVLDRHLRSGPSGIALGKARLRPQAGGFALRF